MTPSVFFASSGYAIEWSASSSGFLSGHWVTNGNSTRPVINLKADVEISGGTGTTNDPFVVKTE